MDSKKLKELVVYIAEKSKDDIFFGRTKLNKDLFVADMGYYAFTGTSITGAKYIHKPNGPVVKNLLPVIETLKSSNRVEEIDRTVFGLAQKTLKPLTGADTSKFSESELAYVDFVLESTKNMNASELSKWSHTLNSWLLTTDGEEIPYQSVFLLHNLPVEKDGIEWGKKELHRLGHAVCAA
jgi:Antitoxin SocA-like, Panacea domain